ncbi:Hypothetical predicted protein [Olea europaea subsp. europaea]|uniref:Uncharacterized protein n=1 Tax=Olea europaea subsp. europaea TaxID=158383 RepID=A0A8S0UIP6_OLEEU|nr:Hypothetical predicted protein [Olea europaea subsp. europaea]
MSRNIRAGEMPLFPFHLPKYVASLTKKSWHSDLNQRPSFSSICRILRCIKRFLIMNPEHSQPNPPMPPMDFSNIVAGIIRSFPYMGKLDLFPISQIPFQMFAYRVTEKGNPNTDDPSPSLSPRPTVKKCISSPDMSNMKLSLSKKSLRVKANKFPGYLLTLKTYSIR